MDADRFDRLTKLVAAARSRRAALRLTAGLIGGLVTAGITRDRVAAQTPPDPPPLGQAWPVCSAERTDYCVSALIVDGVDQLAGAAQFRASVRGFSGTPGATLASGLDWEIQSVPFNPQALRDVTDVLLRVRTGRLTPYITFARAAAMRLTIAGDGSSGWEVEFRGRPAVVPIIANGPTLPNTYQANALWITFSGRALDPADGWVQLAWGGFTGYMATSAAGMSPPRWTGDGWDVHINSPHLMPDGSVTHGSYTAWLAPTTLSLLKLTPAQALAGGVTITRNDGGVVSAVAVQMSHLDGGVLIEIPDLTFSAPTISIRKRKVGCARKCRKGHRCKQGRCVRQSCNGRCRPRQVCKHGRCVKRPRKRTRPRRR